MSRSLVEMKVGGAFGSAEWSSVLAGSGAFLVIASPSLKLLHSSSSINVLGLILLLVAALVLPHRTLEQQRRLLALIWLLIGTALVSGMLRGVGLDGPSIVRYLYLVAVVFLLILVMNRASTAWLVGFLAGWSLFLGVWQLTAGVPTDRALGQHYLTVSMPIGAALSGFWGSRYLRRQIKLCVEHRLFSR